MRNTLHNDEFESYLKEQADKHKMYASDHVWINIQQEIHGYGRWPALTAITLFVISALVVGTILIKPQQPHILVAASNVSSGQSKAARATINKKSSEELVEHLSVAHITQQTIETASEKIGYENLVATITSLQGIKDISENAPLIPVSAINKQHDKIIEEKIIPQEADKKEEVQLRSAYVAFNRSKVKPLFPLSPFSSFAKLTNSDKSDYELSLRDLSIPVTQTNSTHSSSHAVKIDNSLLSKLEFQFYLTPSFSYRRLEDDAHGKLSQSYITAIPYAESYAVDVNQVVHHKPALGYEVGFAVGYKLSGRLSVRTGFQFNMRQYDIDAYMYKNENSPITLANSVNGVTNPINTFTNFRNVPTSEPFDLKNRYYEISMPIGIDWRPIGKGKISWGIATSIQPTYTFDKQPFIITSNYKNYADGSQLMRNWNLNANGETYIGYKMGSFRWQLGPQFRYQFFPTLSKQYPIKEHLLDYGLKVGFVKSIK